MRAVALMLSIALVGCFPHNAKLRRYSQVGEGALIASGLVMEYFAHSGSECVETNAVDAASHPCNSHAGLDDVGLGLILAGLGAFIITVSTAQPDAPKVVELKPEQPDKPAIKLPPGVRPVPATSGSATAAQ